MHIEDIEPTEYLARALYNLFQVPVDKKLVKRTHTSLTIILDGKTFAHEYNQVVGIRPHMLIIPGVCET
jgi:hypothetical protein